MIYFTMGHFHINKLNELWPLDMSHRTNGELCPFKKWSRFIIGVSLHTRDITRIIGDGRDLNRPDFFMQHAVGINAVAHT